MMMLMLLLLLRVLLLTLLPFHMLSTVSITYILTNCSTTEMYLHT
jgi:hypothetical protein